MPSNETTNRVRSSQRATTASGATFERAWFELSERAQDFIADITDRLPISAGE
jgi:hypothetical protein